MGVLPSHLLHGFRYASGDTAVLYLMVESNREFKKCLEHNVLILQTLLINNNRNNHHFKNKLCFCCFVVVLLFTRIHYTYLCGKYVMPV